MFGNRGLVFFATIPTCCATPATGAFRLEDPNQEVFRVFWRKSLTERKILGITISGTGEMGTADPEVMSIALTRQQVPGLRGEGVVNQDLSFVPLGQ
jgi:hypothetical protein